jgi:hypothetical protein
MANITIFKSTENIYSSIPTTYVKTAWSNFPEKLFYLWKITQKLKSVAMLFTQTGQRIAKNIWFSIVFLSILFI